MPATCIHVPEGPEGKILKEDAQTLAKIRGTSLSGLIWDLLRAEVSKDQAEIERFKKRYEKARVPEPVGSPVF